VFDLVGASGFDTDEFVADLASMESTQQARRVARYEKRDGDGRLLLVINTARVMDAQPPYETAVSALCHNQGGWVVVQCYDNPTDALVGHREWVETMNDDDLPSELVEVSGCKVLIMADAIKEGQEWRVKKRHPPHRESIVSNMWLAQETKTNVQSEEYVTAQLATQAVHLRKLSVVSASLNN
jgi:hypothetical protein